MSTTLLITDPESTAASISCLSEMLFQQERVDVPGQRLIVGNRGVPKYQLAVDFDKLKCVTYSPPRYPAISGTGKFRLTYNAEFSIFHSLKNEFLSTSAWQTLC
jgi:hypothetical protein